MSSVKHVTHTVFKSYTIQHNNNSNYYYWMEEMILTLAGQSQWLPRKISGVFNGIQTHDLCDAGALPFNSSLNIFLSLIIIIIIKNEMSFKLNTVIQNFQVLKRAIINYLLLTFCFNLLTLPCWSRIGKFKINVRGALYMWSSCTQ